MKISLILPLFLFISLFAEAQQPYIIRLTKENGLPTNEVYNLHQDQKGYMWIATDKGLYRYDGTNYRLYSHSKMSHKSGSYIKEDRFGRIWYRNFDGAIFYVENDSLKLLGNELLSAGNKEMVMLQDELIYIDRTSSIIYFDIVKMKIKKKQPLLHPFATITRVDSQFYSITYNNKVDFYNSNNQLIKTYQGFNKSSSIYGTAIKGDTIISFEGYGNEQFLYAFYNEKRHIWYHNHSGIQIQGFERISNTLWILNRVGLLSIDLNTHDVKENLVKDASASHVIVDKNKYIWISTTSNGIYIFPSQSNERVYEFPIANAKIKRINHQFILYNEFGEIIHFDNNKKNIKPIYHNNSKFAIYDIVNLGQRKIFSNSNTNNQNINLFKYDNQTLLGLSGGLKEMVMLDHKYAVSALTGGASINLFVESKTPSIWDDFYHKQLAKDTNFIFLGFDSSVNIYNDVRARTVAFDSFNRIIYWGTNIGLIYANTDTLGELNYDGDRLYTSKIILKNEALFILTNSGQLLIKNKLSEIENLELVNKHGPFFWMKSLNNKLYLATAQSIIELELNALESLMKKPIIHKIITHKKTAEINDIEMKDSFYYLTSNNLIIELDRYINTGKNEIPFYVNYILAKNKLIYNLKNPHFNHLENDIDIHFSVLDYYNNEHLIKYRINEETWKTIDPSQRILSLASLSKGEYHISFSIDDIIYHEAIVFTIKAPWYLQWWFIVLSVLMILFLIYLFYTWRIKTSLKENKYQLEKSNLEKDLRNSMLSSIKSQMNPHFLFNALNTIQSFIITEDKNKAANYLSKFSKLTRSVLEMSEKDRISLQEEINTLTMYLDLEKMRFEDFNYKIEIKPNIDIMQTYIPSMILQPYIENAIKHGLLHLNGQKNLTIHFDKKNNQELTITIEDNGIGRKRSEEINRLQKDKHQSFATEANKKRIELLNQEKNKIGVEYIDKTDTNGRAIGTVVVLTITTENH
ncbi:MAG: histidine kinase [Chitinophagales bacterium]|nr:histidine kinase [Chitinophagales bacterium]